MIKFWRREPKSKQSVLINRQQEKIHVYCKSTSTKSIFLAMRFKGISFFLMRRLTSRRIILSQKRKFKKENKFRFSLRINLNDNALIRKLGEKVTLADSLI